MRPKNDPTEPELVSWFKGELRSYCKDKYRVRQLEKKIELLESRFNVHSPNLDGVPVTPTDHDQRLAEYITEKEKYERELSVIREKRKTVERILDLIDDDVRKAMIDVYSGNRSAVYWSYAMHLSLRGFYNRVDLAIAKAVRKG
jgi:hypothetical protein